MTIPITYDKAIKAWTDTFKSETPDPATGQRHVTEKMGETLMKNRTRERPEDEENPGAFVYWRPDFLKDDGAVDLSLESLMWHANELAREQTAVNENKLANEYMNYQKTWEEVLASETPPPVKKPPTEVLMAQLDPELKAAQEAALERAREIARVAQEARAEEYRRNPPPVPQMPPPREPEPEPVPEYPRDWRVVTVTEAFTMFKDDGIPVIDVRGARDFNREAVVGSVNLPAVLITGRPLHWEMERLNGFEEAFYEKFPNLDTPLLVLGGPDAESAEDGGAVVLTRLAAAGYRYTNAMEVTGGYDQWVKAYTPAGKKRTGKAKYTHVVGHGGTICVGSEIITQEDGVFEGLMGTNG